jgi:hypothetical protein
MFHLHPADLVVGAAFDFAAAAARAKPTAGLLNTLLRPRHYLLEDSLFLKVPLFVLLSQKPLGWIINLAGSLEGEILDRYLKVLWSCKSISARDQVSIKHKSVAWWKWQCVRARAIAGK